ncbi:transposase domain-containing protein [Pseudomonas aeruginosa]|uniref:transposase domain-containing protein n=1 Tax=Pseudomonas aeruginosa TaxID=287 RepID=UPI003EC06B92
MSAPTAKLSFEIAQLRRLKFGKKSEQLDAEQRALFDEALDADLAAAEAQLQELLGKKKPPATPGAMPKNVFKVSPS